MFTLFILNSLTRVSTYYFLDTIITSVAALSAGTKTQLACNLYSQKKSLIQGWDETVQH